MMSSNRFLIAISFAVLLPVLSFAEAPVVDDSENFALLDDQQAAFEQPLAKNDVRPAVRDEETALASDNNERESHFNGTSTSSSGNNSNAVLLDKIQGLQQEVQELRGQLEIQAHDLKLLQQQQLAFYKDLDARVRNEPVKAAKAEPMTDISIGHKEITPTVAIQTNKPQTQPIINTVTNPTTRTNPADEQISYLAAYELVKNKRYDDALAAMTSFVAQHPQSGYAANAQYWLGELYMVKKNYPEAIAHFETVLQQFPSSSKSAASLLKIGYALAASGKKQEAALRLQQVMKSYPDTNTAQLAKVKLDSLGG